MAQGGGGEGEEGRGKDEYRIERLIVDVDLVDDPYGYASEEVAGNGTYGQLDEEGKGSRSQVHASTLDVGDQDQGEHIGHRVVATTLQFQCRAKPLLQIDSFASQDGEDRSRIGGGHDGCQQQRFREREVVKSRRE